MRLLNVATLQVEEFIGKQVPPYAILSHTWADEEVTLRDVEQNPDVSKKKGYRKIVYACDHAETDGLDYIWIDTCCIDKSSSAELSEAINSMYNWYAQAAICYAYLADVLDNNTFPNSDGRPRIDVLGDNGDYINGLKCSRWFRRGWTLQELIAPREVCFFDKTWNLIGFRDSNLKRLIADVTTIDSSVFGKPRQLSKFTIAQKMSWAAMRETTRLEDEAYCLLGIFQVNMPLIYGEGSVAFTRLQETIIRGSTDHSFLAWNRSLPRKRSEAEDDSLLLAPGARYFQGCGNIEQAPGAMREDPYEITNKGLRITLPIQAYQHAYQGHCVAVLNCIAGRRLVLLHLNPIAGNASSASLFRVEGSPTNLHHWEDGVLLPSPRRTVTLLQHKSSDLHAQCPRRFEIHLAVISSEDDHNAPPRLHAVVPAAAAVVENDSRADCPTSARWHYDPSRGDFVAGAVVEIAPRTIPYRSFSCLQFRMYAACWHVGVEILKCWYHNIDEKLDLRDGWQKECRLCAPYQNRAREQRNNKATVVLHDDAYSLCFTLQTPFLPNDNICPLLSITITQSRLRWREKIWQRISHRDRGDHIVWLDTRRVFDPVLENQRRGYSTTRYKCWLNDWQILGRCLGL